MTEKKTPFQENKNEIKWNLINSGLAGLLVLLGAWSSGGLSWTSFIVAAVSGLIVFVTKFKEYWGSQEGEYTAKLFNFA